MPFKFQFGNIWCMQNRAHFQFNKLNSWFKRVSIPTKEHRIFFHHFLGPSEILPIKLINNSIKFRTVFQSIKKAHIVVVELWMGNFLRALRRLPFKILKLEWKDIKWLKTIEKCGSHGTDWISSGLVSSSSF